MEKKKDKIDHMLSTLVKENNLVGATLVSRDGLLLVKKTAGDLDTVAAMTAMGVASIETAVSEWGLGAVQSIEVTTNQYQFVTVNAGSRAILTVSLKKRDTSTLRSILIKAGREMGKVLD